MNTIDTLKLALEPVDGTQVSKVWWDGEKLMAKPIPLEDFYLPVPVQAYTPKTNAEWTVLLENRFGLGALSQRDIDIAVEVERMVNFANGITKGQP